MSQQRCRCNQHCDCPPMVIGDDVRFVGGQDVYQVTGYAKTQPKVIIEVNGEAVYVPYECLEVVSSGLQQKLEMAINRLRTLVGRSPRVKGRPTTVEANDLIELLQRIE